MSTNDDKDTEFSKVKSGNDICNVDSMAAIDEQSRIMNRKEQTNNLLPTGTNLRDMRKAAKLSIPQATDWANEISQELKSDVKFNKHAMRRFESIGLNTSYGITPPTYAELNILMRAYNGSPGYLILGVKPVSYPINLFSAHKKVFFSDDMIMMMSDIASWPLSRQHIFFEFYRSFVKR